MIKMHNNALARTLLFWQFKGQKARDRPPGKRVQTGAMPHLSDRMARDMGLSAVEADHLRLRLPSTQLRHPML